MKERTPKQIEEWSYSNNNNSDNFFSIPRIPEWMKQNFVVYQILCIVTLILCIY